MKKINTTSAPTFGKGTSSGTSTDAGISSIISSTSTSSSGTAAGAESRTLRLIIPEDNEEETITLLYTSMAPAPARTSYSATAEIAIPPGRVSIDHSIMALELGQFAEASPPTSPIDDIFIMEGFGGPSFGSF